jgi:hypothetical protein
MGLKSPLQNLSVTEPGELNPRNYLNMHYPEPLYKRSIAMFIHSFSPDV